MNILRTVESSLPSAHAGVASYDRFCKLADRPSFPPTEDTVKLRSTTFNPGKTFCQYLAHLQKASALLDHTTEWLTPTVRQLEKGRKNAQDLSSKFANFIKSTDLISLLTFLKLDSEMGHACFISFLYALRAPSETLRLVRALADDRLAEFIPQEEKALIGPANTKGPSCW